MFTSGISALMAFLFVILLQGRRVGANINRECEGILALDADKPLPPVSSGMLPNTIDDASSGAVSKPTIISWNLGHLG